MNLDFGEIVEPSTRAFWDDYDEDDEDRITVEPFRWQWHGEEHEETLTDGIPTASLTGLERLLIVEGNGATGFVNTAIVKGTAPLGQLSSGTVTLYALTDSKGKKSVIVAAEEKELNTFAHITASLGPWLDRASSVVTVSLQPAVLHKGTSEQEAEQVCFIKSLNGVREAAASKLEAPNVITGIAAGAISYRKFKSLDASAYVCYLDSVMLDSLSSKPILRLLQSLGIPCADTYEVKYRASSNLYF